MSNRLSRRTVLRGIGTAMALPLLEGMLPLTALAQTPKKIPTRMAFLFVPNGVDMANWTPASEGALGSLPSILQPLEKVKGSVNIFTGLTQHNAFALGDGPGDHARSAAAFLTGVHPKKTAGADIKLAISADQVAAQRLGKETRFASLEIGCERGGQSGDCDSGYSCAYSSNIAWRGETTPVAKEVNPRLVFERLFGSGVEGEEAESRYRRMRHRKSILDFVLEDAAALKARLGGRDRDKVEEYLQGVREIEQRLAKLEKDNPALFLPGSLRPSGTPGDYGEHIRLMGDMMVLAFQSDSTRVATFMFANEGSNRSYRDIGVSEGHHDVSHHGRNPEKVQKKGKIDLFHVQQLAYILERMESVKEPGGSLLDHSMVLYGGGISDGDRHNHDDLPILLAGKGNGTVRTGRHVRYPNRTPLNNLFLSMLDRMGVPAETLGDSTGKLQGLL